VYYFLCFRKCQAKEGKAEYEGIEKGSVGCGNVQGEEEGA